MVGMFSINESLDYHVPSVARRLDRLTERVIQRQAENSRNRTRKPTSPKQTFASTTYPTTVIINQIKYLEI